jgi:hypothetical protein
MGRKAWVAALVLIELVEDVFPGNRHNQDAPQAAYESNKQPW